MLSSAVRKICNRAVVQTRCYATAEWGQTQRYEKTVNQVNLLGRVGRDAELRGTEEHPVVVFSMATNLSYIKPDGKSYSRVDWHRISVFRNGLREKVAVNLRKGDRVYVTGSLQYDEFRDSSQQIQKVTTIMANDIVNLTKKYLADQETEESE